ncbi:hypothetical protein MMC26_001699 [Xylographa opegraphella]|nr:hypothetical protein [Xylographa opegraphella]
MGLHPVILFAVQVTISTIVLGFTRPTSYVRLGALPFVLVCVSMLIESCNELKIRSAWAAILSGFAVTFLFQYLDVALLSSWSAESGAPADVPAEQSKSVSAHHVTEHVDPTLQTQAKHNEAIAHSWKSRIVLGASILCSFRFIGTAFEVKNMTRSSSRDSYDKLGTASPLMQLAITTVVCYLLLDFLDFNSDDPMVHTYFSSPNIPFFARAKHISITELAMRISAMVGSGIGTICVHRGVYSFAAFVSVASGLDEPAAWPPLFGSPLEAYSLRRFWSMFWHQNNTRKLSSLSRFAVHEVLGFSERGLTTKYLRVLTTFLASGIMHLLMDLAAGISLQESGAVRFFCTQVVGIAIEDVFLSAYRSRLNTTQQVPFLSERLAGYIWVAAFLTWSSPVYMYPIMERRMTDETSTVVPYSFVQAWSQR